MPVDTIVGDPEMIRTLDEVDRDLSRIRAYERERNCQAGVLLIQRRQFRGLYEIVSKEKAKELISRPVFDDGKGNRTCEWGIKFYPRSFYEELREKLNGKQVDYQ